MINKFSIFNGANYFSSGLFKNYLLLISVKKRSKHFNATTKIDLWEFNGISVQSIENITKSDNNCARALVDHHLLSDMTFNWHCLIKNNISIPKKVTLLYISLTLCPQLRNLDRNFTLGNCLFGSVKVTMNADLGKFKFSVYGVWFDSCSEFSIMDIPWEKCHYVWSWYELIWTSW